MSCLPVGWDRIKKNDRNIGKAGDQPELPHIAGGNVKYFSYSGKQFASISNKIKYTPTR